MSSTAMPIGRQSWPLSRVLILLLAGAFFGLMVDIRIEHVEVVHDRTIAWVPIIYSGFMTLACLGAAMFWNQITRRIMIALCLAAFAIGGTGFYLHNHGRLTKVMRTAMRAWTDPQMDHSEAPPQLAPLAFAGLGLIGILASLGRFNS